jgi:hypothetical protein
VNTNVTVDDQSSGGKAGFPKEAARARSEVAPLSFDEMGDLRQLQQDLRDDWFSDPRRYEDMLSSQVREAIARNLQSNEGRYRASRRSIFNVPKKDYTLRYSLETGIADRAIYHWLVSVLVPIYDPLLSLSVYSHRASNRGGSKYLFRNAIPAWQDFVGSVRYTAKQQGVLLSTDLANYFDGIRLDVLKKTLLDELPAITKDADCQDRIRRHLEILFDCLGEWCFDGKRGLPQNRDASSFLANLYLMPVDRLMIEEGYKYFRYMDDIKIACRSEFEARLALKKLCVCLRERGLSVNSGKTQIVDASDDNLAACLDEGGEDLRRIDAMWRTRALYPVRRSLPHLRRMTETLLRTGDVSSRAFRFCVYRLEKLANCQELATPAEYFHPITDLMLQRLDKHPTVTDQFVRYLRAAPTSTQQLDTIAEFLQDRTKNIYTWQAYCLWKLLCEKGYRSESLLAHAAQVVEKGGDDANRAGATLYAGVLIAREFHSLQSFLGQRTALISVQELHYNPHILKYVQPHLRPDLYGVYKALGRKGVYFAAPERTSITEIIDLDRGYD